VFSAPCFSPRELIRKLPKSALIWARLTLADVQTRQLTPLKRKFQGIGPETCRPPASCTSIPYARHCPLANSCCPAPDSLARRGRSDPPSQ
jgi:hypothetical protein